MRRCRCLSRRTPACGPARDRRVRRPQPSRPICGRWRRSSISAASSSSRATSSRPSRWRTSRARRRRWRASCRSGSASIRRAGGSRGSGRPSRCGRRCRRSGAAATRSWPSDSRTALAAELRAVGVIARLHAGARHPHQPDEPRDRRSRAGRNAPRTSPGSARSSSRRCRPKGIAACGKHFPGHGDTSADSHHELPLVEHPPDRLEAVELVPFKAAIAAGVAAIMTAHILVPALDDERPATLSPRDRRRPAEEEARLRRPRVHRRHRDEGASAPRYGTAGGDGRGDRAPAATRC